MLKVVEKQDAREASEELLPLDEIAREGARRMLIEALKAEADDYVERHRGERDEQGRALVVRNGRGQGRKLTLGAGTVELKVPRVDDRRRDEQGGRQRFHQPDPAALHAPFAQGGRGAAHLVSARSLHWRFSPRTGRV